MADVPHFALPLRLVGGDFATVEQDTPDEVAQSVQVLLTTPVGSRDEVPDYGVDEMAFQQMTLVEASTLDELSNTVEAWEPRARVNWSEVQGVGQDALIEQITGQVRADG